MVAGSETRTAAVRLPVIAAEVLLFNAELENYNWVGCVDRMMPGLVGIDESRKNVEFVSFGAARSGAHQFFDTHHRYLMGMLRFARSDLPTGFPHNLTLSTS